MFQDNDWEWTYKIKFGQCVFANLLLYLPRNDYNQLFELLESHSLKNDLCQVGYNWLSGSYEKQIV